MTELHNLTPRQKEEYLRFLKDVKILLEEVKISLTNAEQFLQEMIAVNPQSTPEMDEEALLNQKRLRDEFCRLLREAKWMLSNVADTFQELADKFPIRLKGVYPSGIVERR